MLHPATYALLSRMTVSPTHTLLANFLHGNYGCLVFVQGRSGKNVSVYVETKSFQFHGYRGRCTESYLKTDTSLLQCHI